MLKVETGGRKTESDDLYETRAWLQWLQGRPPLPLPPLLRGGGEGDKILERLTPGGAR